MNGMFMGFSFMHEVKNMRGRRDKVGQYHGITPVSLRSSHALGKVIG